MTTALVLINAERKKIKFIGEQLAEISGITEVFSVSGSYDLVAIIRVAKNEELAELITENLDEIEGIIKTETMIAFRALSRFDIASMFEIGD